jgi:YD repeat-containing protein
VVVSSRIRSGADEFLERHVWYDGLGRQLATVEQAEGGRTLVTGAKTFGRLGRVIEEYEPFFSQGYALVAPQGQFTSHSYDGLGRRRRSVLPDGSSSEHRYAPSPSSTGMPRTSIPARPTPAHRARSGSPRWVWCRWRSGSAPAHW